MVLDVNTHSHISAFNWRVHTLINTDREVKMPIIEVQIC